MRLIEISLDYVTLFEIGSKQFQCTTVLIVWRLEFKLQIYTVVCFPSDQIYTVMYFPQTIPETLSNRKKCLQIDAFMVRLG